MNKKTREIIIWAVCIVLVAVICVGFYMQIKDIFNQSFRPAPDYYHAGWAMQIEKAVF